MHFKPRDSEAINFWPKPSVFERFLPHLHHLPGLQAPLPWRSHSCQVVGCHVQHQPLMHFLEPTQHHLPQTTQDRAIARLADGDAGAGYGAVRT